MLAIVATITAAAAYTTTPDTSAFRTPFLQSLSASFVQDVVFFSLLGFLVLLLQRRETDRDRNLDDKVDLLFSAKRLRSGEAAYLREQVRTIAADCVQHITQIDVVDSDEERELIQLDVSRRFYVGNYLKDESAQYILKLDITPDAVEGHDPCMHVYPTIVNSVTKSGTEWLRSADDEVLEPAKDLSSGDAYRPAPKHLEIESDQIREFRTRFQAWQMIYKGAPTDGERELDAYEISITKHWDEMQIHVRNSLKKSISITISGKESRDIKLLPGDEHRKAYRIENLSANSKIDIMFKPR